MEWVLGLGSGCVGSGEAAGCVTVGGEGAGGGGTTCGEGGEKLFSTSVPTTQDIKQCRFETTNDRKILEADTISS